PGGQDDALLPTGVGYCWADASHPDWFLLDQSGNRVQWRGYPGHWWMDVGNAAYQDAWLNHVLPELKANGWDGVWIDTAISNPVYYLQSGEALAKYPTQVSYQTATDSFLAHVGPQLTAAGFAAVPNLGGADGDGSLFVKWANYTSGAGRELWGRYGPSGPPLSGWSWDRMMTQMDAVEASNKVFLAISYGSTVETTFMR